jgi:hypothetical protein
MCGIDFHNGGILLAKFDLREYARRGATTRAAELKAELDEIYRAFPDLRAGASAVGSDRAKAPDGRTRAGRAARLAAAAESRPATTARRRRRKMSPAARKAVSERMRRYWAQRRKAKAAAK